MIRKRVMFWPGLTVVVLLNVIVIAWWLNTAAQHKGLWTDSAAAWMQAIGTIDAILAAVLIDLFRRELDYDDAEAQRAARAKVISLKISPIFVSKWLELAALQRSFDNLIELIHLTDAKDEHWQAEENTSSEAESARLALMKKILRMKPIAQMDEAVFAEYHVFPLSTGNALMEFAAAIQSLSVTIELMQSLARAGIEAYELINEHHDLTGQRPQKKWAHWREPLEILPKIQRDARRAEELADKLYHETGFWLAPQVYDPLRSGDQANGG